MVQQAGDPQVYLPRMLPSCCKLQQQLRCISVACMLCSLMSAPQHQLTLQA